MKSLEHIDPIFEGLFSKISPKIAASFTDEQLKAIQRGFGSHVWTRHSVDIRVSFPIPGLRFYLVLLAGSECLSQQGLQYKKSRYPLLNPGNFILLTVFVTILLSCGFTIFCFLWSYEKQQELLWELGKIEIGVGTLVNTNQRIDAAV
ncbi:hypothetical protein, partial [Nostoc sp.]|uniref:hypothetical protein n=1 Tax=Nostoc sp. TaxID=1180 RepID=UPI002FF6FC5C